MPIYRGNTKVVSLYRGTTKIIKVYKGTNVVYTSSRLPAEFQEVEYIESSGTQYIDTGVYVNKYVKTQVTFAIVQTNRASLLFGVYQSSLGACRYYGLRADGTQYGYDVSEAFVLSIGNDKHTYIYNANEQGDIYFDGSYKGTLGTYNFNMNQTMNLFARKGSNGTIADYISARYYNCKIYDNNVLVRNFVPCYRKVDNVAGLYDLVNGVFYTNAGTGTFLKGSNI